MLARLLLGNFLPAVHAKDRRRDAACLAVVSASRASLLLGYTSACLAATPNREIEVKLAVPDLAVLVGQLRRLGATSLGRVLEQNTLYDTPDSDFRRADAFFARVSKLPRDPRSPTPGPPGSTHFEGSRSSSSWAKRRQSASKYKEKIERELVIASPRRWPQILQRLGFLRGFRYEKYRTTFQLPGLDLDLDLDETPVGYISRIGRGAARYRSGRCVSSVTRLATTFVSLIGIYMRRIAVAAASIPRNMVFDT